MSLAASLLCLLPCVSSQHSDKGLHSSFTLPLDTWLSSQSCLLLMCQGLKTQLHSLHVKVCNGSMLQEALVLLAGQVQRA